LAGASFNFTAMSKSVNAGGAENPPAGEMSFEEALKKLATIVDAMENDELPLEKLLTHYEEGVRLHQLCQSRLAAAETRIQQIERNASGNPVAKPIDVVK
jgi:exodeoxyribonuclease VII small subunit